MKSDGELIELNSSFHRKQQVFDSQLANYQIGTLANSIILLQSSVQPIYLYTEA